MNVARLQAIQQHFREHPETCDMEKFDPNNPGNHGCGCIAGFAQTLFGRPWFRVIGIEDYEDADRKLCQLQSWPAQFQAAYRADKAQATIDRIQHFIDTDGKE